LPRLLQRRQPRQHVVVASAQQVLVRVVQPQALEVQVAQAEERLSYTGERESPSFCRPVSKGSGEFGKRARKATFPAPLLRSRAALKEGRWGAMFDEHRNTMVLESCVDCIDCATL
jgi:hypothetical protein